jgi:probable rRNA maturation factor
MRGARRTGPRLRVTVSGEHIPAEARGLGRWLVRVAPRSAYGVVDIAILNDSRMRRLNAVYRRVDRTTDVLSFPADPPAPRRRPAAGAARPTSRQFRQASGSVTGEASTLYPLGDIAIALGQAKRQARALGHDLRTELRVLALHGLLHLLGYDHERDQGQMRRVEERLRRRAGLPTGLISRTEAVEP